VIVIVNGEERALRDGATVADLVQDVGAPGGGRGVAVALHSEVVPRSDWEQTVLAEGDRIEVLIAVQGG
jgi:sulfur carrier protein